MDTDPKELENEDNVENKYVENVIMKPMGLTSNWSIHTRESTERKIPTFKRLPL